MFKRNEMTPWIRVVQGLKGYVHKSRIKIK